MPQEVNAYIPPKHYNAPVKRKEDFRRRNAFFAMWCVIIAYAGLGVFVSGQYLALNIGLLNRLPAHSIHVVAYTIVIGGWISVGIGTTAAVTGWMYGSTVNRFLLLLPSMYFASLIIMVLQYFINRM
jgi:hypothetical protein